ncbi:unnamed protein product [Closterium sp. NIES-65]|nr:unnamed protein product [Closterium sp. NIES-65]
MQLAAVVERLQLQPRGDANIEIKDPTGRLEGSLHWKVMADADNKSRIKRGSALLLRKVVVFSPRKGLQYINITLANVVQVFPPDTPIPPVSAFRPSSSGLPAQRNSNAAAGGTAGFPTPFTPNVPNPHCNTEMMPKTTPAYRLPAATIERREKAWDFTSIDAEDADICLTPMVPDAALDSHRGVPGSRVSAIREASEEGLQPRDVRSREPPTTESQRGLSPGMNVGIHRPSDSVRMHCGPDAQGEGAADVETRGVESGGDCLRRNVHQERGSEEAADVMKKLGWDADAFGAFFEDDVDGFFAPLNGN